MALTAESVLTALPPIVRDALSRVRSSSLGNRFAHGVIWSLAGSFGSRGLTLISSVIVARLLGPARFGEFSAVQSTVGAVLVLAGMGLGLTATKYVADLRETDPGRAARMIALCGTVGLVAGGMIALLLLAEAPTIATKILAAPQLVSALRVSALIVVFGTLVSMQAGALAGFEAFDTIARINLAVAPIGLLAVVLGTYWAGVTGAIAGLVISQLLTWLVNRHALGVRSAGLGRLRFVCPTSEEWRALYTYSAPTVITSVIIAVSNWAAVATLVNAKDGYLQMGIFGAANQWLLALLVIPTIIGQVVFPHATRVVKGGYEASMRLLRHATMVSAAVSLPIVLAGCALSPFLMRAYGSGFRGSSTTLIVVLITAGLMAVQTPAVYIIAAAGRMWLLFATYLLWAPIFLGLTSVAVQWGALGLAGSRLAAYVVHSLAILVTARAALRKA
jgi:O-antigen/teichoic acid export membrane protein